MRLIITGQYSEDAYQAFGTFARTSGMPKPSEIGCGLDGFTLASRAAKEFAIPVRTFDGPLAPGDMVTWATDEVGSAVLTVGIANQALLSVAANYGLRIVHVPFTTLVTQLPDPRAVLPLRDITPAEPYIFPQSHSSLNVFETCPRQYQSKYITRNVPYVQNAAAAFGDQVHNALEAYLKANGQYQLPSNMVQYQRFADWVLNRAAQRGGQVLAERTSAVTRDKKSTSYKDKKRWIGGKIDVTILYPSTREAEVYDWKTGKVKNDQTQLQLYGALGLADYPDIDVVRAGFIWLADGSISPPSIYARANYDQHWDTFEHKYRLLQDAYRRGVFPPKPNGLCRQYCDVTSCEFHGRGRH